MNKRWVKINRIPNLGTQLKNKFSLSFQIMGYSYPTSITPLPQPAPTWYLLTRKHNLFSIVRNDIPFTGGNKHTRSMQCTHINNWNCRRKWVLTSEQVVPRCRNPQLRYCWWPSNKCMKNNVSYLRPSCANNMYLTNTKTIFLTNV